jgi:signal transduction histidine kinase
VRRLLADIEAIVVVRSAAVEAIDAARARLAIDEASAEVYRRVRDRLAPIAERVRAAGEMIFGVAQVNGSDHSGRSAALRDCLDAISASFDELVDAGGAVGEEPRRATAVTNTLLAEIERAVAATTALGGAVTVQADPAHAMSVGDDELHSLRRLLREAVVNARKHGEGHVRVRVPTGERRVIEVENEATSRTIAERAGGVGLDAMRGDAAAIGATLQLAAEDGLARVTVSLPTSQTTSHEPSDSDEAMRAALGRRRASYTATLLALRLTAAGLTAATIQLEATKHRSLLPALTVTSAVLIAWNAGLLASHARRLWSGSAGRLLATIDAVVICGLILAEGGMASPWFALSIGSLVLLGLMRGPRALASFAIAFTFSLLGGYYLVRALGLDDIGTAQQEMPFGWILNAFIYAAAVAIVVAVGWAFARLEDAIKEHERLGMARRALERSAAAAEANNYVRRELHASLQQYVHAALVNLGTLELAREHEAHLALEEGLAEMRDRLAEVFVELEQRPSPVNEGVSLA